MMHLQFAFLPLFILPILAQANSSIPEDGIIQKGPLTDLPSLINKFPACVRPCFANFIKTHTSKSINCRLTGEPGEKVDWNCVCVHQIWPFRPEDKTYDHNALSALAVVGQVECMAKATEEGCKWPALEDETGRQILDKYFDVNLGDFCVDLREDLPQLPSANPDLYPEEGTISPTPPTDLPSLTNKWPICARTCYASHLIHLTSASPTCRLTGTRTDWPCVCTHAYFPPPQPHNSTSTPLLTDSKNRLETCLAAASGIPGCEAFDEDVASLEAYWEGNFGAFCRGLGLNGTNETNGTGPFVPAPSETQLSGVEGLRVLSGGGFGLAGLVVGGLWGVVVALVL